MAHVTAHPTFVVIGADHSITINPNAPTITPKTILKKMDNIIKFRAKRLTNRKRGAWAYGHLYPMNTTKGLQLCICDHKQGFAGPVDDNTKGQFIGLHDQHDKEIFTGDYIAIDYKYDGLGSHGCVEPDQDCFCEGVVVYMREFACYGLHLYKAEQPIKESLKETPYLTLPLIEFDLVSDSIEILGNIYDNPELLTNGKNSKAKRNQ